MENMFKKVILTGATGFIGKVFTKKLLSEGTKVIAIVPDPENLEDVAQENLKVVKARFEDFDKLTDYIEKDDYDVFFHIAWAGYGKTTNDYKAQISNIKPSCDALTAAAELGCKRFLFTSSFSEYMTQVTDTKKHNDDATCNVYGSTKHATRLLLQAIALQKNISFVSIAFSNTYGPGDRSNRSTNLFINRLLAGQDLDLTPGTALYDWNYIDDSIEGLSLAAEKGKDNELYYIFGNGIRPLKEIVSDVRDIINPECKINLGTYKEDFGVDYSSVDIYKLYRDTGYYPRTDFKQSIINTAEWLKSIK